MIDWYLPDFDHKKKKKKRSEAESVQEDNERVKMGKDKIQVTCVMNSVSMCEQGDIGWSLRIEQVQDKNEKVLNSQQ